MHIIACTLPGQSFGLVNPPIELDASIVCFTTYHQWRSSEEFEKCLGINRGKQLVSQHVDSIPSY